MEEGRGRRDVRFEDVWAVDVRRGLWEDIVGGMEDWGVWSVRLVFVYGGDAERGAVSVSRKHVVLGCVRWAGKCSRSRNVPRTCAWKLLVICEVCL